MTKDAAREAADRFCAAHGLLDVDWTDSLASLLREHAAAALEPFRDALEDMVNQFAYYSKKHGGSLHTGGLSALELAFSVLGLDDPHPRPDRACQHDGCTEEATCGTPTADGGYGHFCHDHWQEHRAAERRGDGR